MTEPRIVPPDQAKASIAAYRKWNDEFGAGTWDEEIDLAHTAAVLGEQREAARGYAERRAIACRALGQSDREWLDLLILLDRGVTE